MWGAFNRSSYHRWCLRKDLPRSLGGRLALRRGWMQRVTISIWGMGLKEQRGSVGSMSWSTCYTKRGSLRCSGTCRLTWLIPRWGSARDAEHRRSESTWRPGGELETGWWRRSATRGLDIQRSLHSIWRLSRMSHAAGRYLEASTRRSSSWRLQVR